jgi:Tol biopolymer transport system component
MITLFDVESGQETPLLSDPRNPFYQGQFSPDGHWVAWQTGIGRIQLAFLGKTGPIPESERIQISEEGHFADKPRWSPDGNLLYYTSGRDGFICIYAQPLDPETKRPRGELLDIYHSHRAQLSIGNVGAYMLWIDVAEDKLVFGMNELQGNIWMMDPVE